MDLKNAIAQLELFERRAPVEALDFIRGNWDKAEPVLLKEMDLRIADPLEPSDLSLFFYAIYLCAEMRSEAAFERYVAICRLPSLLQDWLVSDTLTNGMDQMLSRTCAGRVGELKQVVEDPAVDEFARWTAMDAIRNLVYENRISRSDMSEYCTELLSQRLENRPTAIWNGVAGIADDLGLKDCATFIERAYQRELVDPAYECLESALSSLEANAKLYERDGFAERVKDFSTEKEMKDILVNANASPDPEDYEEDDESLLEPIKIARRIYNPTEKEVGRNDPCPCGSGRKYKKCCLGKGDSGKQTQGIGTQAKKPVSVAEDWIEAGYYHIKQNNKRKTFDCWTKAWKESLRILPQSVRDIESELCDKKITNEHFFSNWFQDFQYLIEEVAVFSVPRLLCGLEFLQEALKRFPEMDDLLKRNLNETYSRLLLLAGKHEEAFAILEKMIQEYPERAQGYSVLADLLGSSAYAFNMHPDWERAEQLLLEAKEKAIDCPDYSIDVRLSDVRNRRSVSVR